MQISPDGRYFIAKLYDTVSSKNKNPAEHHEDPVEPDFVLAKVPIKCIWDENYSIKQLINHKLYENLTRIVSPAKSIFPQLKTEILPAGYMVQTKDCKLSRVVSLANQKVLVRSGGKRGDLQNREVVVNRCRKRKIRAFDSENTQDTDTNLSQLYMVNLRYKQGSF